MTQILGTPIYIAPEVIFTLSNNNFYIFFYHRIIIFSKLS